MLDGVSSNIQTQADTKLATTDAATTYAPISITNGASSITTVGALNSGSITSNFGNIDVGNSSISGSTLNIGNIVVSAASIGHSDDSDLLSLSTGLLDVKGTVQLTGLKLNNVSVTSSAVDLNILDGVTATKDDINKLDGLTATKEKLNFTSNVTSDIQTQINVNFQL